MKAKVKLNNMEGYINTRSGIKFNLFDPKPEQIHIEDISHGLAYKGHFAGQTPYFFSIAQHCLLTYFLLPKSVPKELKLAALLHDASEAYIGDMIKPLKIHVPEFQKIENKIQSVIFKAFNLDLKLMKDIKHYDTRAQEIEFDFFYNKIGNINCLGPESVNAEFLKKVESLL